MNYDLFNSPHINPENFCIIKQLITSTLGDLCKSLQNNPTFQKLYRKNTPQRQIRLQHNPINHADAKAKQTHNHRRRKQMSNTPAKPQQLSQEIQKQLSKLNTQLSGANENLRKEVKQVISALVIENVNLKRENVQLKQIKLSKS